MAADLQSQFTANSSIQRPEGKADFLQTLEKCGWKRLRPHHIDIDVLVSPDRKQVARVAHDYGFRIYADLCQRHPGNPYLQKVYEHFTLEDGAHVAIMERLLCCRDLDKYNRKVEQAAHLYKFINHGYEYPRQADAFFADAQLADTLRALFCSIDFYNSPDKIWLSPSLDTHSDNIMMRKMPDGTLHPVLSDPFQGCDGLLEDGEVIELLNPWGLYLRRRLGLPDPAYLQGLPRFQGNAWILD